jgi:hypothetical protein
MPARVLYSFPEGYGAIAPGFANAKGNSFGESVYRAGTRVRERCGCASAAGGDSVQEATKRRGCIPTTADARRFGTATRSRSLWDDSSKASVG